MDKGYRTTVSLAMVGALVGSLEGGVGCARGEVCDTPPEPEQHTHEEPEPVHELRPIVLRVTSGRDSNGPLIIERKRTPL